MLKISGKARIKHAITGEIYEIEADWLERDESAYDKSGGKQTHHFPNVEHEELGGLTWTIWEYPDGIQEDPVENNLKPHILLEDFKFEIISEENQEDDHDNY